MGEREVPEAHPVFTPCSFDLCTSFPQTLLTCTQLMSGNRIATHSPLVLPEHSVEEDSASPWGGSGKSLGSEAPVGTQGSSSPSQAQNVF